jgi:type VI secretion system secreted protein Hcp
MAIYLKYTGPAVNGGVTTKGFEQQIALNSLQWGVGRGVSAPTGKGSNREASTPSISEITVTKDWDESTEGLLKEAFNGAGAATAVISYVRTDGGGGVVYLEYTLSDVMISGWSSSSGGDKPSESLSLNFTKIEVKSTPQKTDGTEGDPSTVTYDLAAQTLS